ncbi:TIGR02444 family protein [Vibrio porteresiae]|uniref:TIGR02444 family protein n=1 Tax=Vibrio porteresiae DSM 19223 TaxID=1123496 RepID=A0ABZ0QBL7_9VIBR|nr:TIGR02444 family protein [Vibrio porteresiae]WPC73853.1 TIGR02444 family protein [Vibrio porteresiae DSM 19223]
MTQEHARTSLTLERLWQFSLQYYSVREVKEACLSLQNQFHGNVNLLLLLKWLDEEQLTFTTEQWPIVSDCLGRSEALLHQFRELRRKLKGHVTDPLYREALQFELHLEKQQQSDLVECITQLTLTPTQQPELCQRYCRQFGADKLTAIFAKPAHSQQKNP